MFFKNFHGTLLINSMETIDSNPTKIRTAFKIYSMSGCSTKSYIQLNLNQEYVICKEKSYLSLKVLSLRKQARKSHLYGSSPPSTPCSSAVLLSTFQTENPNVNKHLFLIQTNGDSLVSWYLFWSTLFQGLEDKSSSTQLLYNLFFFFSNKINT